MRGIPGGVGARGFQDRAAAKVQAADLLNGEAKVVPLGDEWYEGRTVYYVDSCGDVNNIPYRRCDDLCVALILLGNAFTTEEGAKSAAERINADIIEKMGEC